MLLSISKAAEPFLIFIQDQNAVITELHIYCVVIQVKNSRDKGICIIHWVVLQLIRGEGGGHTHLHPIEKVFINSDDFMSV